MEQVETYTSTIFSRNVCIENARLMTSDYLAALSDLEKNSELTVNEVILQHNSHIKWGGDLKKKLEQKRSTVFKESYIRKVMYRPFIAINCYADYTFAQENMGEIFLDNSNENRVICIPGISSKKLFSVLMTNKMPDLNLNDAGAQCFPRWRYPKSIDASDSIVSTETLNIDKWGGVDRVDNISDTALRAFRNHYHDDHHHQGRHLQLRLRHSARPALSRGNLRAIYPK